MIARSVVAVVAASLVSGMVPCHAQNESDQALARQSQNPLANLISLPIQNNTSFAVGPADAVTNDLNIQPVYPVSVGRFNVISRFILPVSYQGEVQADAGDVWGLGDLSYTAYVTPSNASAVTWGVGPSFLFPTATDDRLGTGKWSAGIGAVVLGTPGKWVLGALAQNTWSFAGSSDRADVNFLFAQYFINYNFQHFYLSSAPIITANWEAENGQKWTVPIGGGVGKLVRLGRLPLDLQVQAFVNAVKPDNAGDWSLRVQFKTLFPK